MLLYTAEMNIQFMEVLQKGAKGCTLCHLGKGINILGEALTAITKLSIWAWNVGMGVVNVARKQYTCMHLAPVGTHLLTILSASVEVSNLVSAKHVVHVLGEFCLQRGHHGEFFSHEDLSEQILCTGEDHRLLAEVLDEGALGEELRHIAYLMTGLLGETLTGAGEDGGAHEYGHIRKVRNQFLHECQVLRTIVLGGNVDLQECNVDVTQVIVVTLVRVADEQFTLWVVVFQPVFEGSTYEATSNNSNVNHFDVNFLLANIKDFMA